MDIKKLVEIGGHEWEKNGHHRVYFSSGVICEMLGLRYETYRTGNICHAELNDTVISNSQARQMLAHYEFSQFYFDVNAHNWRHRDITEAEAHAVVAAIKQRMSA